MGCVAIFNKYKLHIIRNGQQILSGSCNLKNGLWDVPFKSKDINSINYIISRNKNKTKLAQYLHGCELSPVISTFKKYVNKRNFIFWPGIDNLNFKKLINTT